MALSDMPRRTCTHSEGAGGGKSTLRGSVAGRLVDVTQEVRREESSPRGTLEPPEEVVHLLVRAAISGVADLAAAREEGVRLVEEGDPVTRLRPLEHAGQVLFRLADLVRDDERQIDPVDGTLARSADHRRRHRPAIGASALFFGSLGRIRCGRVFRGRVLFVDAGGFNP
jgi:hypothetical protein